MHLLIAAALIAQTADPLCSQIARLGGTVREKSPFASLRAQGFVLRLRQGGVCRAEPRGYHCSGHLLPREITEASMAARIAACLPDAKISVEKTGARGFEKTMVRGSGLAFALSESGGEHWHVGRMLGIEVRAATDSSVLPD